MSDQRKLPRFHITPCQFHDAELSKNFSVQDISQGGLALRLVDRADLIEFSVGTEHQGMVKVEGLKTAARFKVKYLKGTLIGGEWVAPSSVLMDHLNSISQPQALGEHLKEYDLPAIANTVWLHNPIGVDLLFYKNTETETPPVIRWTLYIHQSFVQWEVDTGLRTGKALAQDDEGYAHGIVQLETRLIEYDQNIDQRLAESALQLIEAATVSNPHLKTFAINQLKAAHA